jgi:hypothetical protein
VMKTSLVMVRGMASPSGAGLAGSVPDFTLSAASDLSYTARYKPNLAKAATRSVAVAR